MKLVKRAKRKNTLERYYIYPCDCNCYKPMLIFDENVMEYNIYNDPDKPLPHKP